MTKEVTNTTLAVLLAIAIVVSLVGTYLILSTPTPTEITIPQSSESGVINVYVVPQPMDAEGEVSVNVVNNASKEGTP